jgi:uncharacterized C2H2 Zn-finger protein
MCPCPEVYLSSTYRSHNNKGHTYIYTAQIEWEILSIHYLWVCDSKSKFMPVFFEKNDGLPEIFKQPRRIRKMMERRFGMCIILDMYINRAYFYSFRDNTKNKSHGWGWNENKKIIKKCNVSLFYAFLDLNFDTQKMKQDWGKIGIEQRTTIF